MEKIPFFALSIIFIIITVATQKKGSSPDIAAIFTKLPIAISAYAFYLYKMIMPLNLSPLYPFPITLVFPIYKVLIIVTGAIILSFVIIKKSKNPRLVITVWAWFLITLLPVSGIIKIGTQGAADRYTYLPSISLCMIAGLGTALVYKSAASGKIAKLISKASREIVLGLVIILSALLINLTVKQINVWQDPLSLWSSPIENFPEHVPLAFINRAMALEDSGRLDDAIEDYTSAIELKAGQAISHNNRGNILLALGRYELAIEDFNASLKYRPKYLEAFNNRGISYAALKKFDLAISDFLSAIEINPQVDEPYKNLSDAYRATGRVGLAKKAGERAKELGFKY